VTLALAVAFGLGGASLWNSLRSAQSEANQLAIDIRELEMLVDSGLSDMVTEAQAQLNNHTSMLASQIVIQDGNLGIGVDNPISKLHVGYGTGYVQIPHISGSMPDATDCNESGEAGRIIVHDNGIAICPQSARNWVKVN